jgi:hypothetical protein
MQSPYHRINISYCKFFIDQQMETIDFTPGVYEHYKGKKYFALGLSKNTETGEVCVVYRPLYETDWPHLVHRHAEMFFESVNVNGVDMPRFRRIA